MTNASQDENGVKTALAVLNSDGATTVPLQADPTFHGLKVDSGTGGSDNGPTDAIRDDNKHPVLMAVSSSDGVTPVALYVDSSGKLLIQST